MAAIWETPQWAALKEHVAAIDATHLRDLMEDGDRCGALAASFDGITLDYSRQRVTAETMDLLFALADAAGLKGKLASMAAGEHINVTEDRAVMHMALRAPADATFTVDGANVVPDVHAVLGRISDFSARLRSGEWKGYSGKALTDVVSIGIGGSYLGPEFVFEALRKDPTAAAAAEGRRLRFLANVDPTDVARALEGFDPETTLVVVISKTFTTAETMLNARTLRDWLLKGIGAGDGAADDVIGRHMIAVSANVPGATAFGIAEENVFGFWDWVGGRYSVCSAVGVCPLALQYGFDVVAEFLAGAASVDQHLLTAPLRENLPVLMGLLGVWNSSFLGYGSRALLPYAQALLRFPAHIQQVDMESNGKRVTVDGRVVPFDTGEVNFGEPGTNGQHSFYQLIHQGRVVPCDFLGFCESQTPIALEGEAVSNHDELMSNFFAQPDALARGKSEADVAAEGTPPALVPHKVFPGNRPSSSLLLGRLDARTTGQLLALYEHRTAVQGFVWNVASFDQWGVELGKVLAKQVRTALSAARGGAGGAGVDGFNPSTTALMSAYLAHAGKK
mmetsp:Transcript_7208/g.25754  ORF Transcript_7208/g.25754 Transcript_7208/m.25754 type:complete len:563 (-) Transcript_7208:196-1884(-)